MGSFFQYVASITLFCAIPLTVQWGISRLTARRNALALSDEISPLAQVVQD